MKKYLLAFALSSIALTAQAIPDANTGYVGAEVGWSTFTHGVNQFDHKYKDNGKYDLTTEKYGINRNAVAYGVYGGYQILSTPNFGLATEIGYNDYGRVRGKVNDVNGKEQLAVKHSAHGVQLSLKPQFAFDFAPNLTHYGKVGVALIRNDYKAYGDEPVKIHTTKPSLVLGGGLDYAFNDAFSARVEYNWISKVGNYEKALRKAGVEEGVSYSPDNHSVLAGITYRFGAVKTPVQEVPELPAPTVKNISLSSDVAFDFGKANLKPTALETLNTFTKSVQNDFAGSPKITVAGHTDRIGSEKANDALSKRRAEAVANQLVVNGLPADNLTAVGYGSNNSKTGNVCDAVKGRKALIACLAPDRRVDISVEGQAK